VQEHLIVTDDLDANYGIKLSSERLEFLSIDIARLEDKTGVEVDGPAHFVNILDQGRRQPNGPTALKDRLLKHLGWKIIHVPFWEWRDVDGDRKKEEEYCKDIMLAI
jgi:very-short-patch-repair endonuclease